MNIIKQIDVSTNDREIINITPQVKKIINDCKLEMGLVNLSILHTSASLFVQENASRDVLSDIIEFLNTLVPVNPKYRHNSEGPDDMPAHIKTLLTNTNISLSVRNNEILLGMWQGIFLCEHRRIKRNRTVIVHLLGGTDF
mgnify:CR=1 FL=1|tara:strand:+ start:512 stop:934 length:423 start_codon:yes stop_codon:yes gene_type:complete